MADLSCDVVIVGGGVAGGGLANQLGRAGLDVILVEANPVIPAINRGDHISPPSVRMLDSLGALQAFEDLGSIRIHRWKAVGPEAETISDVDLREFLEPPYDYILGLPHPKIHEALLTAANRHDNVRIIRGFRVGEVLHDEDGTAVGVRGRHQQEDVTISARLVAGCDGPRSTVREAAGIEVPIKEHPYHYLMLTCSRHEQQPGDYHHEFWTSSGFVGMFPLGTDRVRCPVEANPGDMAKWKQAGLDELKREIGDWLPGWASDMWAGMEILSEDMHFYKVTTHHTPSYVADGVVLIGDAAHTTPPYLGMGMNIGLRDGLHASKAIVSALAAGDVSADALRPFEEAVREFNQFVIDACENYGSVAAARLSTHEEVEKALATSSALDAEVLGRTYEPYD